MDVALIRNSQDISLEVNSLLFSDKSWKTPSSSTSWIGSRDQTSPREKYGSYFRQGQLSNTIPNALLY